MIDSFATLIPPSLLTTSGKVFYSGRTAFGAPSKLYVLGLNPGGSPQSHVSETVGSHTKKVLSELIDWSAYRDERWEGHPAGTYQMQPRVLHLMRRLNLEPDHVPASNLVFARSAVATGIEDRLDELAELCWPFHQRVIEQLRVSVVLCFGGRCGEWVRKRLNATNRVDEFVESYADRHWKTVSFTNSKGVAVVVATHPSRADWTISAADPTPVIRRMLERTFGNHGT